MQDSNIFLFFLFPYPFRMLSFFYQPSLVKMENTNLRNFLQLKQDTIRVSSELLAPRPASSKWLILATMGS